jgi:hypothetical protein
MGCARALRTPRERDELTEEERSALLDLVHWEIDNRALSVIRAHSCAEAHPARTIATSAPVETTPSRLLDSNRM